MLMTNPRFPDFLFMVAGKMDSLVAEDEIREAFTVFDVVSRQTWYLWIGSNRYHKSQGRQWVHLEVWAETRDDEPWREDDRGGVQLSGRGEPWSKDYIAGEIYINSWKEADIDGDGQINYEVNQVYECFRFQKYFKEFCLMMGSVGSYCKGDSSWTN